jgi:hypothetical protein
MQSRDAGARRIFSRRGTFAASGSYLSTSAPPARSSPGTPVTSKPLIPRVTGVLSDHSSWRFEIIKAWSVISTCWVGFWSWYYDVPSCGSLPLGETANTGWLCNGPAAQAGEHELVPLVVVAAVIIGIPVAVLLTGIAIRLLALQDRRSNPK